jgi:hypothetical protein
MRLSAFIHQGDERLPGRGALVVMKDRIYWNLLVESRYDL